MLETIARYRPLDDVILESGPAFLEIRDGKRALGSAMVMVSRASIAIRFAADDALIVPKAVYGESTGSVVAADGRWAARHVSDAGVAANGDRLFGTMALVVGPDTTGDVAATRLVIAGGTWQGTGCLDGRRVIAHRLSSEVVSHHDLRMTITIEGDLEESSIEAMCRACSFVSGIDVELLRVERYSAAGGIIRTEHRRGFRRLGRGPHSPFTGVPDEDRMRGWVALVAAFPRLLETGVPIDMIVDQISAHNQVAQINVSAQLLLLATVTAAHDRLHGNEVGEPSVSRRQELECLDRDLGLGLGTEDFDRYDKLRVELLDAGYFHKPGYETGRPQRDIKFLRDLAHGVVLRLCGYTGPIYGAERFIVRELNARDGSEARDA
jgi:hypothetical protein